MSLTISNIPEQVFRFALEYEGWSRIAEADTYRESYHLTYERYRYTNGGLEKAIAEYLTCTGMFVDCDDYDVSIEFN